MPSEIVVASKVNIGFLNTIFTIFTYMVSSSDGSVEVNLGINRQKAKYISSRQIEIMSSFIEEEPVAIDQLLTILLSDKAIPPNIVNIDGTKVREANVIMIIAIPITGPID